MQPCRCRRWAASSSLPPPLSAAWSRAGRAASKAAAAAGAQQLLRFLRPGHDLGVEADPVAVEPLPEPGALDRGAQPRDHPGAAVRVAEEGAPGAGVDHPGLLRFEREQRAREHVRLDVHHDEVLSPSERVAGMPDSRLRPAGGLHHYVDVGARREGEGVVGERGLGDEGVAPPGGAAGGSSAVRRKIGDCGDPQAGGSRNLTQEHRAELASTDEPDPHRLRCVGPPEKVRVKVHGEMASLE